MDIKRTDHLTEVVDAVDGIVVFDDDTVAAVEDDGDDEDERDDDRAAIIAKKENVTREVNCLLRKRPTDVEPGVRSIVAPDWPH